MSKIMAMVEALEYRAGAAGSVEVSQQDISKIAKEMRRLKGSRLNRSGLLACYAF